MPRRVLINGPATEAAERVARKLGLPFHMVVSMLVQFGEATAWQNMAQCGSEKATAWQSPLIHARARAHPTPPHPTTPPQQNMIGLTTYDGYDAKLADGPPPSSMEEAVMAAKSETIPLTTPTEFEERVYKRLVIHYPDSAYQPVKARKMMAWVLSHVDPETLIHAAAGYGNSVKGLDPDRIKRLDTWLKKKGWEEFLDYRSKTVGEMTNAELRELLLS